VFDVILQTALASMFRSLQSNRPVPEELRQQFYHLYLDVVWFGIVAGSSLAFLGVYVARLGASPLQMGLLNAGPALMGLLFTMPAGLWLRRQPMGRAVFWTAAVSRMQFLLWALLPGLLSPQTQVWTFLVLVLLFTIPATVLAISFNAMYAAAVPPEYRGQVAGMRNALLALVFVVTSLASGWLLNVLPIDLGYRVIFGVGFVGAALSTYHLWKLRHITTASIAEPEKIRSTLGDFARPGEVGVTSRVNVGLRAVTRGANLLRLEVLRGSYGKVVAALFVFHFAQYMPIPVLPLFWVDVAHFTDWEIGLGTAVFHAAVLLGSLQVIRVAERWHNRQLIAVGAVLLGCYPLLAAFSLNVPMLVLTSVVGGLAWSVMAGSLGNYMLEQAPEHDRPAYLSWYNLALNAAVLMGSLSGSLLAGWIGLVPTLVLAGLLRALSAVALWRWR
jgi:MFS family permease